MTAFSKSELARYSRHLILPEIGMAGQEKLKQAKVLVLGSGGLGSPILLYLAAAGVGCIGIVDFDTVDDSNLQRQVIFGTTDVGVSKASAAKKRIQELNPHVKVILHPVRLDASNALEIIAAYDLVADGTDNFPTRYLVNDACVLLGKPMAYASIYRFDGQVSVFNLKDAQGHTGPNYRDLFPVPPPPGLVPSCAEGGVLGVIPGIIGSMQALEVIKIITGVGETLSGRLFVFDGLSFESRLLKLEHDPANAKLTGLIDYEEFCNREASQNEGQIKEINANELREWRDQKLDFLLIDVREPFEYELENLGGLLIPLGEISQKAGIIPRDKQVVIHCRSGKRSEKAIRLLEQTFGLSNLYNLKGGILAFLDATR